MNPSNRATLWRLIIGFSLGLLNSGMAAAADPTLLDLELATPNQGTATQAASVWDLSTFKTIRLNATGCISGQSCLVTVHVTSVSTLNLATPVVPQPLVLAADEIPVAIAAASSNSNTLVAFVAKSPAGAFRRGFFAF